MPSYSSDMGLRFERLMNNGGLHLFEPRLFYLYVEYEDQDELPVFDAGAPDFRFDRLFAENRFLGNDRIADAHHVALAFTNRWLDPLTGAEHTRLSIGQILRFRDPKVTLPGDPRDIDPDRSEVATELAHNFTPHVSSALLLLWDNDEREISRGSVRLRYYDDQERLLAFAYRYRDQILEQTDFSFSWPVSEKWNVIGRWNYSLMFSENVESFLGVEYTDCCWGVRLVGRQYISRADNGTDTEQSTGIFLELNLLGLGRFGKDFDRYLERDTLRSVYE
ncbi:MAG: LPS assembly protein LptD [Salinisphaeraceae bacterium]|nr:LPS assembly protein LptD [Salinisphaeraceae bacterium]